MKPVLHQIYSLQSYHPDTIQEIPVAGHTQDIAVHVSHYKKQKGIPDTTEDTRRYQTLQGTVG